MTDWYEHRTLYTFDRDSTNPTRSVCTTAYCEMNWPPFRPTAGERARGDYTIINRDDGTSQWAYKGKPLYFFSKDTKTGERLGNDVNGVWHVVN